MVSLRRKKHAVALQSAGQRRSARLMALEEHKNGRAVASMHVLRPSRDAQLISSWKHGRKKNVRSVYEGKPAEIANPSNRGNISSSPSALQKQIDYQMVEYILDMLEVKDTKELFSMPDEFQTTDYCERVSKPGDFATLRQKHKDGMYSTLEQFESDVYMVFNKAITSNSPDSIPYREATCLHEHAKQVFQSLRTNRTYSELELSAWHQKYFPNKRRAPRNYRSSDPQAQCSSHAEPKKRDSTTIISTNTAKQTSNCNPSGPIFPQSKDCSRSYSSKDLAECLKRSTEQPRSTYEPWSYTSEPKFPMVYEQPKRLAFNINASSYKESLIHFLSNAGTEAKLAVKLKWLAYIKHANTQPCSTNHKINRHIRLHNIHTPEYSMNSYIPSPSTNDDDLLKSLACELETDELLKLFDLIGTPEFLEKSKDILSPNSKQTTEGNGSSSCIGVPRLTAPVSEPNNGGITSMACKGQSSEEQPQCTSIYDLSFWKSKLNESKSEARSRLNQDGSSSGVMGFTQYAYNENAFKTGNLNMFYSRKKK